MTHVIFCPICASICGSDSNGEIETCPNCERGVFVHTEINWDTSLSRYESENPDSGFYDWCNYITETIIEPMGQLDKECEAYKVNYAHQHHLEPPESFTKKVEALAREDRMKAAREKYEQELANRPKCPSCGSTNLKKLDVLDRGISVALLGPFSKRFNKSFQCRDCGMTF